MPCTPSRTDYVAVWRNEPCGRPRVARNRYGTLQSVSSARSDVKPVPRVERRRASGCRSERRAVIWCLNARAPALGDVALLHDAVEGRMVAPARSRVNRAVAVVSARISARVLRRDTELVAGQELRKVPDGNRKSICGSCVVVTWKSCRLERHAEIGARKHVRTGGRGASWVRKSAALVGGDRMETDGTWQAMSRSPDKLAVK